MKISELKTILRQYISNVDDIRFHEASYEDVDMYLYKPNSVDDPWFYLVLGSNVNKLVLKLFVSYKNNIFRYLQGHGCSFGMCDLRYSLHSVDGVDILYIQANGSQDIYLVEHLFARLAKKIKVYYYDI